MGVLPKACGKTALASVKLMLAVLQDCHSLLDSHRESFILTCRRKIEEAESSFQGMGRVLSTKGV